MGLITSRDTVFITFDDVIKTPYLKILKFIKKGEEIFKEFLYVDAIPENDGKIMTWLLVRGDVNPISYLALEPDEIDNDSLLDALKTEIGKQLYTEDDYLKIGLSLPVMLTQKGIEKVVIYTPEYDSRVEKEISGLCTPTTKNKVVYEYGEFTEVIQRHTFTSFILNDIWLLNIMYAECKEKLYETAILLTNHAYNFTIVEEAKDENDISVEKLAFDGFTEEDLIKLKVNLGVFCPYVLSMEDFGFEVEDDNE